jgi:hypothetical protein
MCHALAAGAGGGGFEKKVITIFSACYSPLRLYHRQVGYNACKDWLVREYHGRLNDENRNSHNMYLNRLVYLDLSNRAAHVARVDDPNNVRRV